MSRYLSIYNASCYILAKCQIIELHCVVSVSLRRAAAFPVISLLIQFAGQTLCLLGHWKRHQPVIVVVAAFLYVLAGARQLLLSVKLKFYGSSFLVAYIRPRVSGVSGDFTVQLATRLPDWSAGDLLRFSGACLSVCRVVSPDTHDLLRTCS